nr:gamma-glutamylcyclotransferase isoform X1 [Pogona vitticeps]XP_020655161.1 gamma-glutamylcyclotransferase isoform X1 [Pogona vitticeps]XP_020655162.1 gamma-glutamylcyclotransferase isoform X1 [Pogona vitticeps]
METIQSCTHTRLDGNLDVENGQNDSFLYFAYGSNLLRERIMLRNPSVVFLTLAHILDYKLAFGSFQGKPSSTWHGSTATIVQAPGDEVWGVVWKMNTTDLCSLDSQEGVEAGIYVPIEVGAHTQEGKVLTCRSYQMNNYVYGFPSPQYKKVQHKKVICMGAEQNGLPADYQKKLDSIETNNYEGPVPVFEEIEAALRVSKTVQ